ncbi:ATP-dependent RNA helicase HrpA [Acaricomes phytoseiuli]|uniref:ATP-dependent RNA helicase HrpA n=1 Tax=Acaricomes phytoseiuli TaxID=291968 RepID=UPI002222E149|nr:ATP-dependent RNA helicase HrpA [Acaricomes phytoseiuli]MCW1249054.1 ATP-dependent RNA helicase HrpA [Acaricomes phytoseiuli]
MSLTIAYPPELPVSARRDELMAAIRDHQVVVIAGETGSGKTTQIPKMCLELGLAEPGPDGRPRMIGHTQPRRLAARTVAKRIAEELQVPLGQEVGFQVRFTGEVSAQTRVKVMTDGILLAEIQRDRLLKRYSVIIVDEAHERSLNIDFILGYLKRILPERPDLKVIITSATIDPERFAEHFATADSTPAPIEEVSGRTYPVEIRYRPLEQETSEDAEETAIDQGSGQQDNDTPGEGRDPVDAVCDAVDELSRESPGDILIFFSGEREIRDAAEALRARLQQKSVQKKKTSWLRDADVLPLFARLSLAEQRAVFQPGARPRIVLATNVAETSLTVPGIKYVVDTGTARISRYSHRTKVQRLPIERISQASANQRAGRCGRVSAGICIRLYSEEDFNARREFTDPEILRTNLASVILQMNAIGVAASPQEVADFPFVEPPDAKAVADGVALLRELGAISSASEQNSSGRRRGAKGSTPRPAAITRIGKQLAQLPVDPRLGRMIIEAGHQDCVREVMVLAAALTIQDPRERPGEDSGKRQQAEEKHRRFRDENSDFTGYLNLWRYLREQQKELSGTAFRRLCRAEYISYLRVREWQDLFAQLRQLAKPLGITLAAGEVDPVARHEAVHRSVLAGLLSQIGLYDQRRREYTGARGTRFAIFPGSALFKKNPDWVMSAELVETSRLWARVNARIDPLWVEQITGHDGTANAGLLKRSYSEPHWSKRSGAVMAYEKVTLFGLPVVPRRRVGYGKIEPELSRELFIRHALIAGEWRTHHAFFRRNQKLLAELEELQTRARRQDLRVDDETLFDFYDARIAADIVSERHFDSWWKRTRQQEPQLLDFDPEVIFADAESVDESQYPNVFTYLDSRTSQGAHGSEGTYELPLDYAFDPVAAAQSRLGGTAPAAADGVTVLVPVLQLGQLRPEPFRWQVPGLREELVTAMIKSLPKAVRKHFVPAPDVARQAVAALNADFDPTSDELEASLELVLRRLRGHIIPPGSWDWSAVPAHLRMRFRVVDALDSGKHKKNRYDSVLGESDDLSALQESLAGALRQAIAASLGASPKLLDRAASKSPSQKGAEVTQTPLLRERQGETSWVFGSIERSLSREVNGHRITGYPALHDEGKTVGLTVFRSEEEALQAHRGGVIRLLALGLPPSDRYVQEHLNNEEKLIFGQNQQASAAELIADCALAAIDKLVPEQLPFNEAAFEELFQRCRAELLDTVFEIVAVVTKILASHGRINRTLSSTASLPLLSALNDIRAQLDELIYPGFIAETGYHQLTQLPRYLAAIEQRLAKLPDRLQRDAQNMAEVQRLEDEYEDAVAALAAQRSGSPIPSGLLRVRWMIEELRVSYFAVEIGTAYSVSEKRVRRALAEALSTQSGTNSP